MKIAVAGKGGVGKTTVTALLARAAVCAGHRVVAVDADPNPTLAATLGYPHFIPPLLENAELLEERVGKGGLIALNPLVSDLLGRFGVEYEGIVLLVVGGVRGGGQGCACPASSLLRALLRHLVLNVKETVLVDLEAGVEHLGRATAQGVDALLVVTDPDYRSVDTVRRIHALAQEIGIPKVFAVGNKVETQEERDFLRENLPTEVALLGVIPFSLAIKEGARRRALPKEDFPEAGEILRKLHQLVLPR
ncbi:MAG: AAA family ATPase [Candidatus Bipolaricaulaceae bacterium]